MALDGLTIHALVDELKNTLNGGRLLKIAQPENDELQLTVRVEKTQYKLLISAGASLPLMYITENSKVSPLTAPNFCMLLRKHLNNAKIIDIYQPGLERIINIKVKKVAKSVAEPRCIDINNVLAHNFSLLML